jgi:hypothetical protein
VIVAFTFAQNALGTMVILPDGKNNLLKGKCTVVLGRQGVICERKRKQIRVLARRFSARALICSLLRRKGENKIIAESKTRRSSDVLLSAYWRGALKAMQALRLANGAHGF